VQEQIITLTHKKNEFELSINDQKIKNVTQYSLKSDALGMTTIDITLAIATELIEIDLEL
jgi:hypothetical protein